MKHFHISHFSVPEEKCSYLLENTENSEATYYRQLRQIPLTEEKYVQSVTGKGQLHQTAWQFCNTSTSNIQCFSLDIRMQLIKRAVGQVVVQSIILYVENTSK